MKLWVVAVGQRMPDWAQTACDDYVKRFGPDLRLEVKTVKTEPRGSKTRETLLAAERQRIEAAIPRGARIVAMDERGSTYTTQALAQQLMQWQSMGDDVAFVIGGPDGDAGLTGRKIIVGTYGEAAPHGGGAFSGKDPTKVDRSAAYVARYLAKNLVAAGIAKRCTLQLSYAIGVSEPLSLYLNFHDTTTLPEEKVADALRGFIDLTPKGIRQHLQLNRPIYQETAAYGHFGRPPTDEGYFPWEKLDLVEAMKKVFL